MAKDGPIRQRMVELMVTEESVDLWKDTDGVPWVTVEGEHMQVQSAQFKRWLLGRFLAVERKRGGMEVPVPADTEAAVAALGAIALGAEEANRVWVRVAEADGSYWLDIGDPARQAIRVNRDGWGIRLASAAQAKFRRPKSMRPLPIPAAGGSVDTMRPFLRLPEADYKLLLTWMSAALLPHGPYMVLAISGEPGSAKSTTTKLIRAVIDPSGSALRGKLRDERDLTATIWNNHVVAFDNLSGISKDMSDSLCQLATEGSFGGRALYTDNEEAVFSAVRPIILNGIPTLTTRGDLADRALGLHLEAIPEAERRADQEMAREFEVAAPLVLGFLLDTVVQGLHRMSTIRTQIVDKKMKLPRMADFAVWGMAIAPALGWTEADFMSALAAKRKALAEETADANPVATAVLMLMEDADEVRMAPAELLAALKRQDHTLRNNPLWPKEANALTRALQLLSPVLRAHGIVITQEPRTNKARGRWVLTREAGE